MALAPIDIAARQIGLNEHDKAAALTDFMRTGGQNLDPATTAWCAAFLNSTLAQAGLEGTDSLAARSFMGWGSPVSDPQRGDVAVFSRGAPGSGQGHVGFFEGYNPDGTIRVLGGNQGDAVSIASFSPDQLLGFRRAPGADPLSAYGQQADVAAAEPDPLAARPTVPQAQMLDPAMFMNRRRFG